ncbi:hypothetical protein [Pseudomonas sp. RIT-PI-AD]|uniref:hypothetical protein n=1 Tax=Pseudomonas sp. RIT-PI-AD TaxID=3035294 RepID=UPI0021D85B44|nr:hypothetical protein [Pseudomonas sp. RIT-PI-AD]
MRHCLALLLCSAVLAGCASAPQDPSGIWINQAAIEAAGSSGKLRESLLAYGPNLEWRLDLPAGRADSSNGFELDEGRLVAEPAKNHWHVDYYGDYRENLRLDGDQLIQDASANLPEQRFSRPAKPAAAGAPPGSSFEQALYGAYLGGTWKIRSGPGEGGLVLFHPDGSLAGLPGADRYALCLAGDCAAMSGEYDSLWLQQGAQGAPWMFTRDGGTLEIFEPINRASHDEMPEYTPGPRRWLLERE